jgi:uncharacterized protein with FMN-binding domain
VVTQSAPHKRFVFRNVAVLAATAGSAVAVLLYPTSQNASLAAAPKATGGTVAALPSDVVVEGVTTKTKYGPVQVQLRIRKGKIVASNAIQYPMDGGLSTIVSGRAVIKLNKEVLTAQSGHIDVIATATYTSKGYQASLQSALDMAHLG